MATLTIADLDNGKRDLKTVEEVANSRAATATTRFGQQTTTLYEAIRRIITEGDAQLAEQKESAETVIRNLGFMVPVPYAPGIEVTESNFTVIGPDGNIYAAQAGQIPFTTGAWDAAQWYPIQNDLNDHKLLVFNTFVEAEAAAATLPDGQVVDDSASNTRYTVSDGLLTGARPTTPLSVLSGVVRSVQDKIGQEFRSIKDYGAIGDGTNHPLSEKFTTLAAAQAVYPFVTSLSQSIDWAACQAAVSGGGWIFAPAGGYYLTETVKIPSNCTFTGEGIGRSVFFAPSTDQHQSAFHTDCGTINVLITDIELRGGFYRADGDYTTNPVQAALLNNGIDFRGRYYQQQKNLPRTGENFNFTVERVKIAGFGSAGIRCDQIDNVKILQCDIQRCGAFGIHFLGCINHWAVKNVVKHISPGDPLNGPGNRVYGITTNRVYGNNSTDLIDGQPNPDILLVYRRPENGWFVENYVEDCITWKGLDTHGGKNINFLFNTVTDCHMAIGIDMAGYLARHGYARVEDIRIIGNTCMRYKEDQPNEGHIERDPRELYAGAGAGIHVGAKEEGYDGPADLIGRNLEISGNNLFGWGEKGTARGAIYVFNWDNVLVSGNIIRNSRGRAISFGSRVRSALCINNIIRDVRYTDIQWENPPISIGVAANITLDSDLRISGNSFYNTRNAEMKAIGLSGEGTYDIGLNRKVNTGPGSIKMYARPNAVPSGEASNAIIAQGYVSGSGSVGNSVGFTANGLSRVVKTAEGEFDIYLVEEVASGRASVNITPRGGFANAWAIAGKDSENKDVFKVKLQNLSGAPSAVSFFIQVWGLAN